MVLHDGERLDDLLIHDMKIIQHEKQFRYSLDAVLLAHFATLKTKTKAMDLGTGTGVIALLLAALGAEKVVGVEINPIMADLAKRSVALNALTEKITIYHTDLRELPGKILPGSFDLVVSNPPYRVVESGKMSQMDDVAKARHEITAKLCDIVNAARSILKFHGRFAMVHLPERLAEIVVAMHEAGIEPKRLRFVHATVHKKPSMVLVEGIVGGKAGLLVEKPLLVYEKNGQYTDEIMGYYGG